jgi:hypothetical protein
MRTAPRLVCAAILLIVASCTHAPKESPDAASLKHVYYHRTGGIAGVDDRVEITPDGKVGIARRGQVPHELQLTRDQVTLLREAFRGFDTLRSDYPAPRGAADDFQYEVRYGAKTVTGRDTSVDLPPQLRDIWLRIEAIAH